MSNIVLFVRERITAFRVLYVLLAAYTLRHSAMGFATLDPDAAFMWSVIAALAVDAGMMLAAESIHAHGPTRALTIALVVTATVSAYTQLLFAFTNATAQVVAPGAAQIGGVARLFITARVVLLPVVAPLLVMLFAFASKRKDVRIERPQNAIEVDFVAHDNAALPAKRGTYREQIIALLRQNPRLTDKALQEAVGCRDIRTVRAARAAFGGNA